ncbi:MAG: hypothetical protein ISEC1_P1093 [Thiomicrorhabdus sp.]|nr:MAG: hypothetical protein ISEC1_P1093 [Thiomicrorhabdus sp.]
MIGFILRHPIAVGLSVLLHIIIISLITAPWSEKADSPKLSIQTDSESKSTDRVYRSNSEPLKTFAVDATLVKQQLARIKAEDENRINQQRLLEAKTDKERTRLKAIQKKKRVEQAKAEKARRDAEMQKQRTLAEKQRTLNERKKTELAKRLADLEQKKANAERLIAEEERSKAQAAKKQADLAQKVQRAASAKAALAVKSQREAERQTQALEEENLSKAAENKALAEATKQAQLKADREKAQIAAATALQRQLDEEAAQIRAERKRKQILSLKETYISSIAAKVKDNWRTPARISADAQCDLRITQTPTGSVSSVKVLNCNQSATKQFKDAAEKAVYRSEPIPQPPIPELFERVITFEFKP